MQATMMNFGNNTRVVSASDGKPIRIEVGSIIDADIHEVHFNMIRNAVANETLLVVPKDVKPTEKLAGIMELMKRVDTEEEHALIRRFTEIAGPNPENIRPTRGMIRIALREIARTESRKTMMNYVMGTNTKVNIRESVPTKEDDRRDGVLDIETGRKLSPEKPPEKAPKAKKKKPVRERL
jgi:hypothetical protein